MAAGTNDVASFLKSRSSGSANTDAEAAAADPIAGGGGFAGLGGKDGCAVGNVGGRGSAVLWLDVVLR